MTTKDINAIKIEQLCRSLVEAGLDPLIFGNNPGIHQNILVKCKPSAPTLRHYRNKKFICLCMDIEIKPLYYGIFIPVSQLPTMSDMQDTVLHVTCLFVNSKKEIPEFFEEYIGKKIELNIIGISCNQSGQCLIVENNHILLNNVERPHITLFTKPGSRPVDVGKHAIEPIMFKDSFVVTGIFSPSW